MRHKNLAKAQCPIARSLEHVGEWWSILIIRDALHGLTRFDQFEQSLGIAPNMLTRRLSALVKAGIAGAAAVQRSSAALRIHPHRTRPRFPVGHHRDARLGQQAFHARGRERAAAQCEDRQARRSRDRRPQQPRSDGEYRVRGRGRTGCRRTHAREAGGERMGHHATPGAAAHPRRTANPDDRS